MVASPFPNPSDLLDSSQPSGNFETVEWAAPFRASKGTPIQKTAPSRSKTWIIYSWEKIGKLVVNYGKAIWNWIFFCENHQWKGHRVSWEMFPQACFSTGEVMNGSRLGLTSSFYV